MLHSSTHHPYDDAVERRTSLALALLVALSFPSGHAHSQNAGPVSAFDATMLRSRGIDLAAANRLYDKPRYTGGTQRVMLVVNGQRRGMVETRFDAEGQPCLTDAFLEAADLVSLAGKSAGQDQADVCHDLLATYPQARIEPQPELLALSLVVPTEAIRERRREVSESSRGGNAAVFNYDAMALHSRFSDTTTRFITANTELGFNAGDWIVRSRNTFTSYDGMSRNVQLDAYAQRTFVDHQAMLQVGQINLFNPVLSGARITGIQVITEHTLAEQQRGGVQVQGIALGQARVEVRQDGALVYSTVVPAGQFTLNNVRRLNSRSDLEVTVLEEDGSSRSFVVPAALAGVDVPPPGYTMAAGRVRDIIGTTGPRDDAWVASAGWTGAFAGNRTVSAGAMVASDYMAAGGGLGWMPWQNGQVLVSVQASQSRGQMNERGALASASFSQQFADRWSINAGAAQRTTGYRDLLESYQRASEDIRLYRYKSQYSIGSGWQTSRLGSFNASYADSTLFDGSRSSRGLFSWGAMFGRASLSVAAEWSLGGKQTQGNLVYATLSVPLGKAQRLRTSVRTVDGGQRSNVALSGAINENVNYQLGAEQDSRQSETALYAGLSVLPRYAQLDFGYRRNGPDQSSYNVAARGGVVWHDKGITLSPYAVQETFAVASVGDVSGAKLSTPSGPVWTDFKGRAIVAQLPAYTASNVEVVANSLPRNVDLDNGLRTVNAGRGAVENIGFSVSRTRRILLTVDTGSGAPLPKGAAVVTADDQLVTLVQADGRVFLPSVQKEQRFWVKLPDDRSCELHFELPTKVNLDVFFEKQTAICTFH